MATNVPVTYYFIGTQNNDALGGYLDEANLLLGLDAPPLVLTTSYGQQESTISFELTGYVHQGVTKRTELTLLQETLSGIRAVGCARRDDPLRFWRQRPGMSVREQHEFSADVPL